MEFKHNTDAILFDLDGTLWDSVDEILFAWNRVILSHPGVREPISRAEQESCMGMQMDDLADRIFPGHPPALRHELMQECMQAENRYLWEHGGRLYPELEAVLERLHTSYRLFIVSNCQSGYIEAFLHAHSLAPFFSGYLCFGDTGLSKCENITRIVRDNRLRHPIYVGDTQLDRDAARSASIPFVYAAYGFGTVSDHDGVIATVSDLLGLFPCSGAVSK